MSVEFKNISKRYGKSDAPLAVSNISFDIPTGSLTTILGPSGCGKTTTLRMIAGLEMPSAGQVFIDGKEVTTLGAQERNVSMMFQSYALFPHMNVLENVMYGLKMSGFSKHDALSKAQNALKNVGLVDLSARAPSELSGGQQQRVALARALVLEPAVLLFDEPLSNLDARLRRAMRDEIRSLQQRLKLTVAYVTHDQNEALAVSDQIIVMDHGIIAQRGTPQALYAQPATEFVAKFMGEAMIFDADADGQHIRLADYTLALTQPNLQGKIKLAIRPEAWQICSSAEAGIAAMLLKKAYLGSSSEYVFQTELGEIWVIASDDLQLQIGTLVRLQLGQSGISVLQD